MAGLLMVVPQECLLNIANALVSAKVTCWARKLSILQSQKIYEKLAADMECSFLNQTGLETKPRGFLVNEEKSTKTRFLF